MPSSPLVGLVLVPLGLIGVTLIMVKGGVGYVSPQAPWELLTNPPSPFHAVDWMRWSNPPRDLVIAADLERIVMGFLGSAVVVGLFTLLSPNWNRPATADPNTDPRKERSIAPGPLACLLGAVTHHLLAMRIAALRTAPGYAAIVDARAGLKKQTGPPFQDIGAMVGGVLGFLLGFREFGNIADRCIEFAQYKRHRNLGQVAQIFTGVARLLFTLALFRHCVVPATKPL